VVRPAGFEPAAFGSGGIDANMYRVDVQ